MALPIKKISIDIMNQQTLKKFKIQNSIAFLHINNRNSEKSEQYIFHHLVNITGVLVIHKSD